MCIRDRSEQLEVGPAGEYAAGRVHHVLVRNVTIGEHNEVNPLSREQTLQVRLGHDLNAVRIERAGQLPGVTSSGDAGDLSCGGEGHHLDARVIAVDDVEVMKVAPSGPHDDNTSTIHGNSGPSAVAP